MKTEKASKVIWLTLISLAPVFFALSFLPVMTLDGAPVYGIDVVYGRGGQFSFLIFIAYFLPVLASLSLLLKSKVPDVELLAALLFLTGGILISIGGALDTSIKEIGYKLHSMAIFDAVLCFLAVLTLFILLNVTHRYSVYEIVESAMLIALAIGLDLPGLKIQLGANGGSISFTTVPLLILALRQGPLKGFIGIGVVYGLITCLLDGWGLYTYPFDYLLGYGSLAILGFFKPLILSEKQTKYNVKGALFIVLGTFLSVIARLAAATLSGMIFYDLDFVGSLIYNMIYVLPSGAAAIVVLLALYKPLINIDRFIIGRSRMAVDKQ